MELNDKTLRKMAERRYSGDCTNLVKNLCQLVLAERGFSKTVTEQWIRDRQRLIEIERKTIPMGRVLIVDTPPPRDDIKLVQGELVIYSDPLIEFRYVSLDTPHGADDYDEALEAELKGQFRSMPWELSSRNKAVWIRWTTPREI